MQPNFNHPHMHRTSRIQTPRPLQTQKPHSPLNNPTQTTTPHHTASHCTLTSDEPHHPGHPPPLHNPTGPRIRRLNIPVSLPPLHPTRRKKSAASRPAGPRVLGSQGAEGNKVVSIRGCGEPCSRERVQVREEGYSWGYGGGRCER